MGDDFLEELRGGRAVDSTARFTVDVARARAKLRAFALADPDRYLVHLVEAAFMGGATWVEVGPGAVRFDGPPFDPEEDLRPLLAGLLQGRWDSQDRRHPLALAVNSLVG